ncbi:MAG: XRE family transcriptional regulator [Ekhidna sp.]|uniref:XRE family transcriptional regulator n=1 Tax=Ekhidna sp. TaxID=2608089 RepID=UPI0032EE8F88
MITEKEYKILIKRIDELLLVVDNSTPEDHPNFIELNSISELVADYEEHHYPVEKPNLVDVIS